MGLVKQGLGQGISILLLVKVLGFHLEIAISLARIICGYDTPVLDSMNEGFTNYDAYILICVCGDADTITECKDYE